MEVRLFDLDEEVIVLDYTKRIVDGVGIVYSTLDDRTVQFDESVCAWVQIAPYEI